MLSVASLFAYWMRLLYFNTNRLIHFENSSLVIRLLYVLLLGDGGHFCCTISTLPILVADEPYQISVLTAATIKNAIQYLPHPDL